MYLSYAKESWEVKWGIGDYGQISVNNTGADNLWFTRALLEVIELRGKESH